MTWFLIGVSLGFVLLYVFGVANQMVIRRHVKRALDG